ncbi:hypothetical protein [Sinorhizobium medicae]|uniref:hypothetical protein n=1 Tax=Sinorhizobium medicae TaxID=110321 RepID=UPI000FDC4F3A|nr:hypothetical protein [Sinorhizobium medicae]RVJ73077.1 hypothetical protein CN168_26045 [Sinorhizobium medicae]
MRDGVRVVRDDYRGNLPAEHFSVTHFGFVEVAIEPLGNGLQVLSLACPSDSAGNPPEYHASRAAW